MKILILSCIIFCASSYCIWSGDRSDECLKKGVFAIKKEPEWHPSPVKEFIKFNNPIPQQPVYFPPTIHKEQRDVGWWGRAFANRIDPPRLSNVMKPIYDFEHAKVNPFERLF